MGYSKFDVRNKLVLVAGGSQGLGKELSLQLVDRGANVIVIARSKKGLQDVEKAMKAMKLCPEQVIETKSLDLTASEEVSEFVNSIGTDISSVICVAGGTSNEIGTLADISPDSIRTCMEKNYYTSAYLASAVMKRWTSAAPSSKSTISTNEHHHLVFTASTAALVSVPGYAAYAPTKAAIRTLADTLRLESLMYQSKISIKVHCSFPGTIYTDSFNEEQFIKPQICKEIEGTMDDKGGLSAAEAARRIMAGLDAGNYFITLDTTTWLLLNNMRGCSPRQWGILEWFIGLFASLVWPVFRIYYDWKIMNSGCA